MLIYIILEIDMQFWPLVMGVSWWNFLIGLRAAKRLPPN